MALHFACCCIDIMITVLYFDLISSSLCSCLPAQADAPNTGLIPESDAVGVTVVLITCTYRGQEFIRIGYYVNNEYTDPELRENPPLKPDYTQVTHTHSQMDSHWLLSWIGVLEICLQQSIYLTESQNRSCFYVMSKILDAVRWLCLWKGSIELYCKHCFLLPSGALKSKLQATVASRKKYYINSFSFIRT